MVDEQATFAGDALRLVHAVVMDDRCDEDGKPIMPTIPSRRRYASARPGSRNSQDNIDLSASNPLEDLVGGVLLNTDVNPDGEPSHQIIDMASLDPSDDQDRPDRMPMSSDTSSVVSYSRHRRSPYRPDVSELRSTTVRSSPLAAPEHSEDQGVTAAQVQARRTGSNLWLPG